MEINFNQEDKEAAKEVFDRVKESDSDTASLFEVVDALRLLGLPAQSDKLYKENKSWDVNFEQFCMIYSKMKEEKDKKELNDLVLQSFEALGGNSNQQGAIDVNKLTDIFSFYQLDIEPEDFLQRANLDLSSTILYEDYLQIFELSGTRQ
ncbi:hypothetical protein GPJ56_003732 [Histomonas meleagridis]|uniref:uncharacterized protein n=1 Tax=Histomonas meleagridis TaxID=135588 RepID=UPI00355A0230|nr:hypothetical protein GPJ56_003732 [Histomonas meleagridis]KAH0805190.1 hypothetical protein GO595_002135 [Histomonas meleagridis]